MHKESIKNGYNVYTYRVHTTQYLLLPITLLSIGSAMFLKELNASSQSILWTLTMKRADKNIFIFIFSIITLRCLILGGCNSRRRLVNFVEIHKEEEGSFLGQTLTIIKHN